MNLPEITVALHGTVISKRRVTRAGRRPGEADKVSFRLGVLSADQASATEVSMTPEEDNALQPQPGTVVSWLVRPFPWDVQDGPSGVSFLFVRPVSGADLDQLATAAVQTGAPAK